MKHHPARWAAAAGSVVGAALVFLPIDTYFDLEDWERELRRTGVPAPAYVFEHPVDRGSRSMLLRYQAEGVTHQAEITCYEVCLPVGATPRIWYNAADPLDFVTDFGELSGERGSPQGLLGLAGLLLFAGSVWLAFGSVGWTHHGPRLVVLIDPVHKFVDGRPARRARSSAAAITLLETLRGRHIDELWLDHDLDGETAWPVVEWLQEQAYAGDRPDIGQIVIPAGKTTGPAQDMTRALREWAYEVRTGPSGQELT
ncbi:cyclic-phosphate processing receiver domain-containing protein [Paractinoplanes maris]|uniref:cyclic-phosphate processing receiver domain-containing protein n=1 Tax=Paractinoplanes maris TaxID=1734446 RepID=UPI0020200056|nr:cyclic-phosphate processing receiver domain-containing protein [Actinoplanes maris]